MDGPLRTTDHFERRMRERPEIDRTWCQRALTNPIRVQVQEDGKIRYWAHIPEIGKYIRVVTMSDGETVHTAFLDRRFRGVKMKFDYDVETDSLYIRLSEGPYLETEEVAYDIMFDFDCDGTLMGIEILSVEQNATPSKLHSALQNLPEELCLDEKHQVQLAFDQILVGKHKLLDPIV